MRRRLTGRLSARRRLRRPDGVRSKRPAGRAIAAHFIAELRGLLADVGLPPSLRAAGIAEPAYERLVPLAAADGCLADNPREFSPGELETLYRRTAE